MGEASSPVTPTAGIFCNLYAQSIMVRITLQRNKRSSFTVFSFSVSVY